MYKSMLVFPLIGQTKKIDNFVCNVNATRSINVFYSVKRPSE